MAGWIVDVAVAVTVRAGPVRAVIALFAIEHAVDSRGCPYPCLPPPVLRGTSQGTADTSDSATTFSVDPVCGGAQTACLVKGPLVLLSFAGLLTAILTIIILVELVDTATKIRVASGADEARRALHFAVTVLRVVPPAAQNTPAKVGGGGGMMDSSSST